MQVRGLQIPRCPAPPPWRSPESGTSAPATLEGELLASQLEECRIPDRRSRPGVPRNLSPILPRWEELGLWTASAPASLFWALLQGHPGVWDSPALQPGGGLIPAPRVRGPQESVPPTALSRSLRSLGPERPLMRLKIQAPSILPLEDQEIRTSAPHVSKRPRILVPGA